MGSRCFLCNTAKSKDISFHKFPKNSKTRSLWFQVCNLDEDIDNVSTLYICSKHFAVGDYIDVRAKQFGGTLRLKPEAVPQIKPRINSLHITSSNHFAVGDYIDIKQEFGGTLILKTEALPQIKPQVNSLHTSSNLSIFTHAQHNPVLCCNSDQLLSAIKLETITPADTVRSVTAKTCSSLPNVSTPISHVGNEIEITTTSSIVSNDSPTTSNRKKFILPRYAGNITEEDFETPSQAVRNFHILKSALDKKNKQLKTTQQQNRRLREKINSLKELVAQLNSENLLAKEQKIKRKQGRK